MIPPEKVESMQSAWLRLLDFWKVAPVDAFAIFDRLVAHYSEANRHYHTLEHLGEMFRVSSRLLTPTNQGSLIQLAIWFHDAIYDSKARDNEDRSAALAGELLAPFLPASELERVQELILATREHAICDDSDTKILLDSDLAILGAEAKRYDRYAQDIRKEYAWVAADTYRIGRAEVIRRFLERPRIYQTERLFEMGEAAARENLNRELLGLMEST